MTTTLDLGGVNVAKVKKEVLKLSTQFISRLVLVGILLALIPTGVIAAPTTPLIQDSEIPIGITFDIGKSMPLALTAVPTVTFTIGESRADEAARIAAEHVRNAAKATVSKKISHAAKTHRPEPDFSTKRAVVQAAAAAYGIPWEILEAVWQVESGKSWDTHIRSHAGAQGPAQFMPATWRRYGVDGNGDGVADINSAVDALHGAANYLATNGANRGEIYRALYAYNHADWYVQKVLNIAREIGYAG